MKLVLNKCYGGFGINDDWKKNNCLADCDSNCAECPILIKAVENGEEVNDDYSALDVVEIPDNATDWRFDEYDGIESLIYVVDGKLYDA